MAEKSLQAAKSGTEMGKLSSVERKMCERTLEKFKKDKKWFQVESEDIMQRITMIEEFWSSHRMKEEKFELKVRGVSTQRLTYPPRC